MHACRELIHYTLLTRTHACTRQVGRSIKGAKKALGTWAKAKGLEKNKRQQYGGGCVHLMNERAEPHLTSVVHRLEPAPPDRLTDHSSIKPTNPSHFPHTAAAPPWASAARTR